MEWIRSKTCNIENKHYNPVPVVLYWKQIELIFWVYLLVSAHWMDNNPIQECTMTKEWKEGKGHATTIHMRTKAKKMVSQKKP